MALFKIFKGDNTNNSLDKVSKNEGYCYVTTNDMKMYIDISSATRSPLNAYKADIADTANNYNTSSGTIASKFSEINTDLSNKQNSINNINNDITTIENEIANIQEDVASNTNNFANYLPLSAGSNKKITGELGITAGAMYGASAPSSGFVGQLFFVEDDENYLPNGGTAGQMLIKTSSTDGDASWQNLTWSRMSDAGTLSINTTGTISASKVYGAVWNDYAEYRICHDDFIPGQVVCENGDDTVSVSTERLQPGGSVVTDTYGFAIGETNEAQCPIAVSGRVLAYPYEDRNEFKPGEAVCAGPNGTVSRMTREEVWEYPERIIGTVSAVPSYTHWGETEIPVNGRIWIKVR